MFCLSRIVHPIKILQCVGICLLTVTYIINTPATVMAEEEVKETGTNKPADTPILLAGKLNLEDVHNDGSMLVYDADTRIGSIMHDAFFTMDETTYLITHIEVTNNKFSLQITRDSQETNEASVLADYYIILKEEFSAMGYINANAFTAHPVHPNIATVPLSVANGLQKDDFLEHITFEITTVKPTVDRYPEEIQPLPIITQKLTDGPISIPLTQYFRDPEGTRLSFNTSLDGVCCVVRHDIQGSTLILTPIGVGTTAIEVEIYDSPGYLTTGSIEVEILKSETPAVKDALPPIIKTDGVTEVPSHTAPAITITVDHRTYTEENLQVTFGGSDSCKHLSSDTIEGTSNDVKSEKSVYKGILTGGTKTSSTAYGYQETEQIGNLTPTTVEIDDVVYRIKDLLYTNGAHIALRIPEDTVAKTAEGTEAAAPDLSDYYLVLKNKNETIIGYATIENATTNQETLTIPLKTNSPIHNKKWFNGTADTTIELTKNRPEGKHTIPPQKYTVTVKGPPGIYNSCTLTVEDIGGNKAKEPVLLSMFTILQNEKQREEELRKHYPRLYAPFIPEQQTPKKPYSLLIEHQEKEEAKKLLEIGELALQLASPDISTSSVQKVDLGRRSYIPEVENLQIFLNLAGYTVAQTGWGSRGMETEYFGPATEKAIKALQRGNDIPVTGEFDEATQSAILNITLTKAQDFLNNL